MLQALPPTVELDLGDGVTALCFHGSPSSNEQGIYSATPDETLEQMLGDASNRSCSAATPTSRCCAASSTRWS